MLKVLDSAVKEVHWKSVIASAVEKSFNQISVNRTEIIKTFEVEPFNIKTECNPIFYFLFESISFEMFAVSEVIFMICKLLLDFVLRTAQKKLLPRTRVATMPKLG